MTEYPTNLLSRSLAALSSQMCITLRKSLPASNFTLIVSTLKITAAMSHLRTPVSAEFTPETFPEEWTAKLCSYKPDATANPSASFITCWAVVRYSVASNGLCD